MSDRPPQDPVERAAQSAEKDFWTLRQPADVRRMVARVIREQGRDKNFWTSECIRLGLAKYAGRKDGKPVILKARAA